MNHLEEWIESLLVNTGIPEEWAVYLRLILFILILILLSGIAYVITKRIIIHYLYKFVRKSSLTWDDALADHKVFNNVAHIIPAILVRIMAPVIFADFEQALPFIIKITDSYLLIVGMTIIFAFLRVAQYGLASHPIFKDKPIASYFQLARIILYIVTGILVLSLILEQSPVYFLSAFGAMTAIVLLIFKDTILGLVASVQMSSNDMVRVGDWVEMPKYNADGDVIEINLNTVKIQNWDRTITSIPTYYFITDSFKNWRGMQQSGGRRIKRAIYIDSQTVKFVDPEMREELKKYHLLKEFLETRQKEIEEYNEKHNLDTSVLINGRRMTNLGVFRKYVELYLKNHPQVNQDMTVMVRQLGTESRGIPLEIYCFTNTTAWLEYETIQADIFDHLYATVAFFDLDIFQEPSGRNFSNVFQSMENNISPEN
ncbi:mechanosensitive ion channel family protein [Aliifodinibius sp. S!AR15-10]|uniref:mechanosensitive ion channel family protein n=1 Tax=Aliifodinibius sp. S!AR15-10 TaxID=2950437 RepID=UPI00285D4E76|nr:mechanosensitive ion channel family protein [Aliifodinibius sp. S!AR15-10]MDR8389847.1 mechanosensitive ion channel family protein [Aliifodinibius sp. S!AR15-10]